MLLTNAFMGCKQCGNLISLLVVVLPRTAVRRNVTTQETNFREMTSYEDELTLIATA